jgi:hypothetical protein
VHDVAASVAAGYPTDRLLAAYPSLDAEKLRLAAIYAEANPPRGRPRVTADLPEGSIIVAKAAFRVRGRPNEAPDRRSP